MTHLIRSITVLALVAVVLAACGTAGPSADPTQTPQPTPTEQPSTEQPSTDPSVEPSGSPEPVGILTIADGMVVDGPGTSLAEALASDLSQPVFVRGVLFRDTDGTIYLADSLVDEGGPTFSDLRVVVENMPSDGPSWDMANAELTGLQEVNGIRFYTDGNPFYGTIRQ